MSRPEVLGDPHQDAHRIEWANIQLSSDKPVVSIITSTFNAVNELPWTIESIRSQTYPYIQWIVADGGSQDGTVDLLEANEDIIDVWFSGADSGIYDAWNKALPYLRGDWVLFLGAGDELAAPETLSWVAPVLGKSHPAHDLVYGCRIQITERNRRVVDVDGEKWADIVGRWSGLIPRLPPHPALFHHVSLFSLLGSFDASLKLAADADFVLRALTLKKEPRFVNLCIDRMPLGGATGQIESTIKLHAEQLMIIKKLGIKVPRYRIVCQYIKLAVKRALLAVLGKRAVHWVADGMRLLTGRRQIWTIQ